MPCETQLIPIPETWMDAARKAVAQGHWLSELTRFVHSREYTHFMTQTLRTKVVDPFEAWRRHSRFLADLPLSLGVTEVLLAVEPHPGGHGSHIHALLKTDYESRVERLKQLSPSSAAIVPPFYRRLKERSWRSIGRLRVSKLVGDSYQTALNYCLKYVLKGLRRLESATPPKPWEPMEREPLWGIWTRQVTIRA